MRVSLPAIAQDIPLGGKLSRHIERNLLSKGLAGLEGTGMTFPGPRLLKFKPENSLFSLLCDAYSSPGQLLCVLLYNSYGPG